ncbi:MAG: FtsX-like permease family protein [Oscillospiraceae bacterium]|nr:FtsX-like permease family protein [Oscillospiraceae bacterium]
MAIKAMQKTTFREIWHTFGRFFAILAIIALGVGFFTGVRITTPAMIHTVNGFLQEYQFYDYRLLSTLGWEDQDVEIFKNQPNVRYAEGSNTLDILYLSDEDENENETEFVCKTHSLPEHVNQIQIAEGRLPERSGECLADAGTMDLRIGDVIRVSPDNSEDTLDSLGFETLTVVGTAYSSYYVNFERGTTSIGNGNVAGYVYILPEDFDLDYYSEIFIRFDRDDVLYSQEYKDFMEEKNAVWENLTQIQAEDRYQRILSDAQEELDDAKKEFHDKRKDGEQELSDAKQELSDAEKELSDAEQELKNAREELDDGKQKLSDAEQELNDAEKELDNGRQQLDQSKQELEDARKELDSAKQQLLDSEQELLSGEQQIADSRKQIEDGQIEIQEGQKQLNDARAVLEQSELLLIQQESAFAGKQQEFAVQFEQAQSMWEYLPEEQKQALLAGQAELESARIQLENARTELDSGRQELNSQQAFLNQKQEELTAGLQALEQAQEELDAGRIAYEQGLLEYQTGEQEYQSGLQQYQDAEKTYQDGKTEYESGLKKFQDSKKDYEAGLQEYEKGRQKFEDGKTEFTDGQKEYQDGKQKFDEKIAAAEKEIADAEEKIAEIEKPDSYVLDRNTNVGYVCFESDSQIVEQIAKVFPIFFILVAALVCMTTMSRMVEEQRTQIGTFKALGYSEFAIMGKFLIYSGSASLIGCVIGYFIGTAVFPYVIWMSYELMYTPIPMEYLFDWKLALASLGASLLCSMGTTWISCRHELAETSAGLMRPKAPKAGKRVFLEYLPFLWNRLKFLHKVSVRNIFRYKRRFFMMIVGISGCTALLLTGFGVNDSIAGFADVQYTEILIADAQATLKSEKSENSGNFENLEKILDQQTQEFIYLHQASWDLLTGDKIKAISLLAPFGDMHPYLDFHTIEQEPLAFPGMDQAIVSNSISERYGVAVGDEIMLRNEDMQELHLTVTGIFENHVYNYIYILPETMEQQLSVSPEKNTIYMNFPADADQYQAAAEIAGNDSVTIVSLFQDLKNRMANMMDSLKYIVLLVIICAGGLAFVVLYNLTNINITERIREIATIKVLGFFRNETSAYVLRENIFLTALGIAVGLVLGVFLHRFIMLQIVVDMVSFKIRILPMSFVYSIALTFLFNLIINFFMEIKLDRINMAESLKSVD